MQWIIVCTVISVALLTADSSVNYCGAKMCGYTNYHTFCMYPIGPSQECIGYMTAQLAPDEKEHIMARLNRRRNEAATGRIRGLGSAGNMVKLRWVEELAHEAQRWADQCQPPRTPEQHDSCRDLYSISVGQCVASVVGEAPGLRVESMIDVWYMQSLLYKGNLTYYVHPANNFSYYGDFGQMMWSYTYMVGCGRSRFMSPWQGRLRRVERLVCNFAPRGPTVARPIWTPAFPTSLCPARSVPDKEYSALCDFQHELDVSNEMYNTMTLQEHIQLNTVLESENESLTYEGRLDDLYLTKLAIALGDNTTSHLDSMQENNILKVNENEGARNTIINNTEVAKKVNLIGRPKSYNLEELNIVSVGERRKNDHIMRTEKETYGEYEFLDVAEDNDANVVESSTALLNEKSTVPLESEPSSFNSEFTIVQTTENIMNWEFTNASLAIGVNVISEAVNDSTTEKINVDDYLPDSETVRELQEALDHIEHTLEATSESIPAKVRRDLREYPPNMDGIYINQYINNYDNNQAQNLTLIEDGNYSLSQNEAAPEEFNNYTSINSTDTPMLNMVLKYMPYLKQYQKGFSGQTISKEESLIPSPYFYVILILFL